MLNHFIFSPMTKNEVYGHGLIVTSILNVKHKGTKINFRTTYPEYQPNIHITSISICNKESIKIYIYVNFTIFLVLKVSILLSVFEL